MGRRRARGGYLTMEAFVSVLLLGGLAAAYTQIGHGLAAARDRQLTERALRLAAEGQMERYRAGAGIEPTAAMEWPRGAVVETAVEPGEGVWEGMRLVTVTARGPIKGGRMLAVQICGYLAEEGQR